MNGYWCDGGGKKSGKSQYSFLSEMSLLSSFVFFRLNCVCDTREHPFRLSLCVRVCVCVSMLCHWSVKWYGCAQNVNGFCMFQYIDWFVYTYSGKSPSTRHIYCFCTWRLRIWCSIWRAFFGLRPNSRRPDVRRSKRWIVRRFFKLNSFASMKTTVLWRYRPHGCT